MKTKLVRTLALVVADLAIVSAAYYGAFWLRLDVIQASEVEPYLDSFWSTLPWLLGIRFFLGLLVRQYTWSFRHSSLSEAFSVVNALVVGSVFFIGAVYLAGIGTHHPPRSVYLMEFCFSLMGMEFVRFAPRYIYQMVLRRTSRFTVGGEPHMRTLIYGAGHTGQLLLRDILRAGVYPYVVKGFIDDNPLKQGTSRQGVRVLGDLHDLPELVRKHRIDNILVAIPDLPKKRLRKLVDLLGDQHIRFQIIPPYTDLLGQGAAAPATLKDVRLEDLLERPVVDFDQAGLTEILIGKTVLVTGAAGSIGSEICRQIARLGVRRLVALDINENDLYFLQLDLNDLAPRVEVHLEIASIRDSERVEALLERYRPQVVFHAAAHKHVPLMEDCPGEAIKNNALATLSLARAAARHRVERFVLISTDKAVRPTSVMGASKRLAEIVVSLLGRESGTTRFRTVRFGNVLGSAGSLVPILRRQIEHGGPVTITHPKITRFFMTIPEAVGLVLIAAVQDEGAVSVLEMGEPLNIDSLARQMISLMGLIPGKDIEIVYTGLRPGEKMYEELFTDGEELETSAHPRIRIAHPAEPGVEIDTLERELREAVEDGSDETIRDLLRRRVPGYLRPGADDAPPQATPHTADAETETPDAPPVLRLREMG